MTPQELYRIWAPPGSIWSDWVAPAFFANFEYIDDAIEEAYDWEGSGVAPHSAVVIDMPGDRAIGIAMRLCETYGHRPVPVINAAPGAVGVQSTVDLSGLAKALLGATPHLARMILPHDAPPAFLLESTRLCGIAPPKDGQFDNRWQVFPQDFPSASFLINQGIDKVVLVHESQEQPSEDLTHVLRRWQDGGLPVCDNEGVRLHIQEPPRFGSLWYRALAASGFRRNRAGGFGAVIPQSQRRRRTTL